MLDLPELAESTRRDPRCRWEWRVAELKQIQFGWATFPSTTALEAARRNALLSQ
jgi:hypothetical protein